MHAAPRHARRWTLLALAVVGISVAPAAADSTMILAWDPAPASEVIGYRVYIGTQPGVYSDTRDVGNQTLFFFPEAQPGQRYYFAVASYASGLVVGPPSPEVSGVAEPASVVAPPPPPPVQTPSPVGPPEALPPNAAPPNTAPPAPAPADPAPQPLPLPVDISANALLCSAASGTDCYTVGVRAQAVGAIDSLAAAVDGRLFFIERGRSVKVVSGGLVLEQPALEARGAEWALSGLAFAPDFATSRFVYVGEVESRPAGGRELSIVRYREARNLLGEGSRVITGVALPPSGDAPFAVSADGHVYVAVPSAASNATASAYGGYVLRFNIDGSVPRDNRAGSPIFAQGDARPTAMVIDDIGRTLWYTGTGTAGTSIAALALDTVSGAEWPRAPQRTQAADLERVDGLAVGSEDATRVLYLLTSRRLYRAGLSGDGSSDTRALALEPYGSASALAAVQQRIFIATRPVASAPQVSILELQRPR